MNAFPQTIHFIGSNTPRRVELSIRNLAVEGEIPAEIDGAFFRAVPDNAHAPRFEDDIALNADGMIARFSIENGAADFDIRYVETERYLTEKKARRALFGRYRNPFTDDPSVAGVDRTVVVPHDAAQLVGLVSGHSDSQPRLRSCRATISEGPIQAYPSG